MKGRENKQNTLVYVMFVCKSRKYSHYRICVVTHNSPSLKIYVLFIPQFAVLEGVMMGQAFLNLFGRVKHFDWTLWARLHETRSELKPVWNLKPLWNVIPFIWQFRWRFHWGNFPNNNKTLLHRCKWYLLINAHLINAKKVLSMIAFNWCKLN